MYASVRCHDRVFLRLRGAEMGGKPVEDFEYEENEDGGITITRYIGEETEVVIPEKINEKNVTVIGKDAFSFILHLEFVKIARYGDRNRRSRV